MRLTLEDVARYPRPGMAIPGKVAFAPDGRRVTFLHSAEGDLSRDLWQLDLSRGERSILVAAGELGGGATEGNVSLEEALRRERQRLRETGITEYEWAAEAPVLLVPVRGELYVHRGDALRLVASGASEAHLSGDGTLVGFVREGELYVVPTTGGEARRLTHDAEPGLTNGLAEFIAQEEMGRQRGFWFSDDGTMVAFVQVDERHVPELRIPHLAGEPYEAEVHRYPFAGRENARVRLGVVPLTGEGEAVTWLDLGDAEYLARVDWTRDGRLLVQLQPREQSRLELRLYEARGGGYQTLLVEEAASWINLHDDLRPLEDGHFLWASERSGFKHLYLYRHDRLVRTLTTGEWQVDAVAGVHGDVAGGQVIFTATRESPLQRHVYRVPLAGGEPERLSDGAGLHQAVVARDGSAFVDTAHDRGQAPRVVVHALRPGAQPSQHVIHAPQASDDPGFAGPELVTFTSRDGLTLHGALYRPAGGSRAGSGPPPLVVSAYGGPHAQLVQESWLMTVDLRAQFLAQQGFAVWVMDNRGSARRGLAFESAVHRRLGTIEVQDQVDGVRHLVSLGLADPARVGIYGWSYGGYLTLMCLARAPEVFRAGVAGAPVTEWEGYDTHYTERYMGTPQANPGGYREGSVLTHAPRLTRPLLIIHGLVDENVHFRHSARLLDALVKAGAPPELLLFPTERHMPRGERDRVTLESRVVDFFVRHLAR
ncbi:MAG TPA: DPP IV N-terminal domain-containing protein [Chloroflexota bacterium]|nr:DPP IV N-terminal domain-containing protein [Chloroflexota bacterium]